MCDEALDVYVDGLLRKKKRVLQCVFLQNDSHIASLHVFVSMEVFSSSGT